MKGAQWGLFMYIRLGGIITGTAACPWWTLRDVLAVRNIANESSHERKHR
jgi:hypothetical protein